MERREPNRQAATRENFIDSGARRVYLACDVNGCNDLNPVGSLEQSSQSFSANEFYLTQRPKLRVRYSIVTQSDRGRLTVASYLRARYNQRYREGCLEVWKFISKVYESPKRTNETQRESSQVMS